MSAVRAVNAKTCARIGITKLKSGVSSFFKSRTNDLCRLVRTGTIKSVNKDEVHDGSLVSGSRFVDQVKQVSSGVWYRILPVAHNYADEDAAIIITKTITVHNLT